MRAIFFLAFLLVGISAIAQKKTLEVIEAGDLKRLVIASDEVFKITVSTGQRSDIIIRTTADGEYYDEISLESEIKEETMVLRSRYREILQSGFDKLSVHKVLSMEVELEIPDGMEVIINSNVATVYSTGRYESLFVELNTGSCYLRDFVGNAVINTYDGNVLVETANAVVQAISRNGAVDLPGSMTGMHKIAVTSINGNISVQKN